MVKYISLGCNCVLAIALTNLNLKQETLPFDWIPNNTKIVVDCLETDFKYYNDFSSDKLNICDFNGDLCDFFLKIIQIFYHLI